MTTSSSKIGDEAAVKRLLWAADGDYKISHDGGRWWGLPYDVYGPDGHMITCCATLRGAKRVIRLDRARRLRVVHREAA